MPVYLYRGRSRTGTEVRGQRQAASRQALANRLRRDQVRPVMIREKAGRRLFPRSRGRVKPKELAVFTRQLSVMIDAGLPLVQCLDSLGQQQENSAFQRVLQAVREDVENGTSLAAALERHPRVFDPLYSSMVAAGEAGGILDTILRRLSTYIEKAVKLKRAVVSAMVYPAVVLAVAMAIVLLVLWKVVPMFATLFTSLQAELPLPTRVVIATSQLVGHSIPFLMLGAFGLAYTFRRYYATPDGRHAVDRALLRIPILGGVMRKIAISRFSRTLATLLSGGVPILESLAITAGTAGNAVVEEAVLKTRGAVQEGKAMAETLRNSRIFPPIVTQMVGVGEQTGALDAMLTKLAEFYEDEVDAAVSDLLTALEPLLILLLGLLVGGIVISMYLPLFSLISRLSLL